MILESDFDTNYFMKGSVFCKYAIFLIAYSIKITVLKKISSRGAFKITPFQKSFRYTFITHLNNGVIFKNYFLKVI